MDKINYALIIIIGLIAGIIVTGLLLPHNNLKIDNGLKDNKAAQEIAAYGVEVDIEDLGVDGNNLTVLGQTRWVTNGNVSRVVEVVLDDSVDANSYQAYAILYHELYHLIAVQQGLPNNEAAADDYAASRGYNIVDAYHGIH
jgi:hypothetical protein